MQKINNRNTNDENSPNKGRNNNNNTDNEHNRNNNDGNTNSKTDDRYLQKLIKLKKEQEKYVRRNHWGEYESRAKEKTSSNTKPWEEYRPTKYTPISKEAQMTSDEINEAIIMEQALLYARTDEKEMLQADRDLSVSYLETFHSTNYNKLWKLQIQQKKHRLIIPIVMVRLFIADSYSQHNTYKFKRETVVDYIAKITIKLWRYIGKPKNKKEKDYATKRVEQVLDTIQRGRYYFNKKYFVDTRGNGMFNKEKLQRERNRGFRFLGDEK